MTHQFAWIEQPFSEGRDQWLLVRFNPLFIDEVERLLADPNYMGISEAAQYSPVDGGSTLHDLNLLFAGKLKALSSIPLIPGLHLSVEINLYGEPSPVNAVAVVSRQSGERRDGMHVSSLRILAVGKEWRPQKPAAELPQYMAWA